MAARTLEQKRDYELECVRIDVMMFDRGLEPPTVARMEYMARRLATAIELQKKIEKREAKKAATRDYMVEVHYEFGYDHVLVVSATSPEQALRIARDDDPKTVSVNFTKENA